MNDETQDKHYSFDEGMPTAPDVEVVAKAYPNLQPGSSIPRAALYELLKLDGGTQRGYNRLRSIMAAFMHRMMRDHALPMGVDRVTDSYRVWTAEEVAGMTPGTLQSVKRKMHRQRKNLNAASRYAPESLLPQIEHDARLVNAIEREARKANLNRLPQTVPAEMPQIAPPNKDKQAS